VATDIAPAALDLARENAQRLGLTNVAFVHSDWYAQLPADGQVFDVVVSNPPYVDRTDPHMQEGDLRFEPAHALTPGHDALLALRRIILDAPTRVVAGGHVAVEHGYDQHQAACALFETAAFTEVRTARDLAGIPRVTYGRRP
jgi:release factor glutamine methyltransferase